MTDRSPLLADRSDLAPEDREHLRMLISEWTLLADLGVSDLVLWVPTWNRTGYMAVAQVRPTTGPTLLPDDQVGQFVAVGRRAHLDRAVAQGRITTNPAGSAVRERAIPVVRRGQVVAVILQRSPSKGAAAGALEDIYRQAADDLAEMILAGEFPGTQHAPLADAPPRVGDGLIRLRPDGRVAFASPNASSALHRLGLAAQLVGSDLAALALRLSRQPGPVDEALAMVAGGRLSGTATIENADATVNVRALVLRRSGQVIGALVLLRDVTDLRRQQRALLSKEATIREIHHRVKNNLATVAALLRLQARRISEPEGAAALNEAVRRVGAIAVVHETLAHATGSSVPFDEVADRVLDLTADLASGVKITRIGSAGQLPPDVATSLAMVMAELLANATQHGLQNRPGSVSVSFERFGSRLRMQVADEGVGLAPGFDPAVSDGLGLQIVRTLVVEELGGAVAWEPGKPVGTVAVVDLLVPDESVPD